MKIFVVGFVIAAFVSSGIFAGGESGAKETPQRPTSVFCSIALGCDDPGTCPDSCKREESFQKIEVRTCGLRVAGGLCQAISVDFLAETGRRYDEDICYYVVDRPTKTKKLCSSLLGVEPSLTCGGNEFLIQELETYSCLVNFPVGIEQ